MIHSVRFTCVLDTNVIYPLEVRDLLFWFAYVDLYTIKWSKHIFDEWKEVMLKKGVDSAEANKRIRKANLAFPDALVENYESLINGLSLKDEKDRHVMAAAIKINANIIVTNNIKDFPEEYLTNYGLSARSADDFATDIIDLEPERAVSAFKNMVMNRKKPDLDEFEVLDMLRNHNMNQAANYLHSLI